jgi:hypothetical protein
MKNKHLKLVLCHFRLGLSIQYFITSSIIHSVRTQEV